MNITPLIICGALGRMGRACIERALSSSNIIIKNGTVRAGNHSARPEHWPFALSEAPMAEGPAVLVDFSHQALLKAHLEIAYEKGWPVLVGTTGHDQENRELMKRASSHLPVLYAPNTSIMANLLIKFAEMAGRLENLSAHIVDIHHAHKKDAPSGTALAMKAALLKSMPQEKIIINSVRVGDVVGEHQLCLFKENERLELNHRVYDRRIFAEGALIAAQFLYGQGPGLYDMNDVLNLK